uniref:Putative secreted protein n=1 Tax=Anopheles triannulatus TaxID=58253 RepID=A0A2M4B2W7_9DIPT
MRIQQLFMMLMRVLVLIMVRCYHRFLRLRAGYMQLSAVGRGRSIVVTIAGHRFATLGPSAGHRAADAGRCPMADRLAVPGVPEEIVRFTRHLPSVGHRFQLLATVLQVGAGPRQPLDLLLPHVNVVNHDCPQLLVVLLQQPLQRADLLYHRVE